MSGPGLRPAAKAGLGSRQMKLTPSNGSNALPIVGNSFSEAQVADAYRSGEGFALNQTEALKWYRKAAAQKNAYAQMRIGEVYLNGTGVERNLDQAFRYFQQGANSKSPGRPILSRRHV